jgi:hypothetical protein
MDAPLTAGQAAATGAIPVKVAALTEGVMKAMLLTKLKTAIAVVLMLGFVATGATILTCHTAAGQDDKKPTAEKPVEPAAKQEKEKEAFTVWGKEAGGLQAGLGYLPGQHRTYYAGETAILVVRVRNVSKDAVKFQYLPLFFKQTPPIVADGGGKPVHFRYGVMDTAIFHIPVDVNLAPGKETVLGEVELLTTPLGTGKFTVQYERVFGMTAQGRLEVDPTLKNLGTGKLDLGIKSEPPPSATPKDTEKEAFTAWGKEVGVLQAGLGFRPGEKRAYGHGETVTLVVRVRNVGKKEVEFQYLKEFFKENPPIVTDADGKKLPGSKILYTPLEHVPEEVSLAPGKEIELSSEQYQLMPTNERGKGHSGRFLPLWTGTGKVSVQYNRLFGNTSAGRIKVDPDLLDLTTGSLELEIKPSPPPATEKK